MSQNSRTSTTSTAVIRPNGPVYEIVEITPELAKDWLRKYNTHNRNVRERVVAAYAADMVAGRWRETGDNIKRAHDGTIIDGQHRLHAIVRSGITLRMLVVSNLPMEVQENVDGQTKRTFADVLSLRGEHNAVALGAVARRVWYWNNGYPTARGGNIAPTTQQLLDVIAELPELRASAAEAVRVSRPTAINASTVGLTHWLFNRIDVFDCAFFFDRLADGAHLATDSPIYILRKTVRDNQSSKARLTEEVVTAYVIKAWNAFRDGRPISFLRFKPGGANPEQFPEPK